MIVENLLHISFPVEQAAKFALDAGARVSGGTDMEKLAKALCKSFPMDYQFTSSIDSLIFALNSGCMAIINVGGDRTGHKGVFSNAGHYIVATKIYKGKVEIADSGLYNGKYDKEWRRCVKVRNGLVYSNFDTIQADTENRSPRYYIFRPKM